jgi:hypothetical protein
MNMLNGCRGTTAGDNISVNPLLYIYDLYHFGEHQIISTSTAIPYNLHSSHFDN